MLYYTMKYTHRTNAYSCRTPN